MATSAGIDGLDDLVGQSVVVARGAEPVAGAVTELLGDLQTVYRIGQAVHDAVTVGHTWDVAFSPVLASVSP